MAIEVFSFLVLAAVTIILGYLGSLIFDRTRIPDVIWLLLLGLLVGPGLHLVDVGLFVAIIPLFTALAIILILFDAGLNLDFYQLLRAFPRGTLLAVLHLLASAAVVATAATFVLGWDPLVGLLLGIILGGTSSATVLGMMSKLRVREQVKNMLNLESILSDPLTIVLSLVILQLITAGTAMPLASIGNQIASAYSIGAVLGFIAGAVWLLWLRHHGHRPYTYMLTLSVLLLLYVFTEGLGGSGAMTMLLFGLVLGNSQVFGNILRLKKVAGVESSVRVLETEITFFIRSFFFVFIGVIASITVPALLYGLLITVLLLGARPLVATLAATGLKLETTERNLLWTMAPRGLAAAVLAQFPVAAGLPEGQLILNIVFVVLLLTTLYATLGVRFAYKPEPAKLLKRQVAKEPEA